MNRSQILKLISKQWCNTNDLMVLSQLVINISMKLKNLKSIKKNKRYLLPKGLLPMNIVVKKLRIDIPYLKMIFKYKNK